jgi:hypothetical protein
VILGWTDLQPSVRERQLRLAGALGALICTLLMLAAAAFADPRRPWQIWSAAAIAAAATAFAFGRLRPPPRASALAIDADGDAWLRRMPAPEGAAAARCGFAAPWLITLRCGTMWVAIWPDSLPTEAFRRLSACAQWAGRADSLPSTGHNQESG